MGYTHYWDKAETISDKSWNLFLTFVKKAMADQRKRGIEIVGGCGEDGTVPDVNEKEVYFNGCGEGSHETFGVGRFGEAEWQFCKTARKEYDTLVVACCIAAKAYGVFTKWESDGNSKDHAKGRYLFKKISRAVKLEQLDNDITQVKKVSEDNEVDQLSKIEQKLIDRRTPIMEDADADFIEGVKATIEALRKYNIEFS